MYRDQGVDFQTADATLGEVVQKAATMPLLAQPGTAWNYSIATDVIGHLVAEISGMPFAQFLHDRVIAPIGMTDTAFTVAPGNVARFAANYARERMAARRCSTTPPPADSPVRARSPPAAAA